MKSVFFACMLSAVALAVIGFVKKREDSNSLCTHTYALCTSAQCVPDPCRPTQAICFCDVEEGLSMGTLPCHSLKPSVDPNGVHILYSTFSPKQFKEGKKAMTCPEETPWTWCLNKRCSQDPNNPKRAICLCDIVKNQGEWVTLGGDCDTDTCTSGYWSGASMKGFEETNAFMAKALGLHRSPVKWCPEK